MRAPHLGFAAAAWTAAFVVAYLLIIRSQAGTPAWWYIALLAVAAGLLLAPLRGRAAKPTLIGAAIVLGLCSMIGILSIGIFLVPAVIAATFAAAATATPALPDPVQHPRERHSPR
jgi:hypothetical protein